MTRYLSLFFSALTFSLFLSFTNQTWAQNQLTEPSETTEIAEAEFLPELDPGAFPEPIQHLKNKGLDIVRKFPVGASLTGWVVNYEGSDMVVYTRSEEHTSELQSRPHLV